MSENSFHNSDLKIHKKLAVSCYGLFWLFVFLGPVWSLSFNRGTGFLVVDLDSKSHFMSYDYGQMNKPV